MPVTRIPKPSHGFVSDADLERQYTTSVGWQTVEGGSQSGAPRVLGPFPFAFDDAGLNDGIEFYTPTVDDILLDAWIEIDEAWDGTTPLGDIGFFDTQYGGFYGSFYASVLMSLSDFENPAGLLVGQDHPDDSSAVGTVTLSALNYNASTFGAYRFTRTAPAKFSSGAPLKFVVSVDGGAGSAAPGASQGSCGVYLIVVTPSLM